MSSDDVLIYEVNDGLAWLTLNRPDARNAQEMGATIAANAPLSVAAAKRMVYATAGASLEEAFAAADAFFEPAYLSEDAQEGPRAFREGRAPQWRGR